MELKNRGESYKMIEERYNKINKEKIEKEMKIKELRQIDYDSMEEIDDIIEAIKKNQNKKDNIVQENMKLSKKINADEN